MLAKEEAEGKITSFIKEYFASAGKKKAIVGVSGGIDSALAAALAAKALGKENVIGVFMRSSSTPKEDAEDAYALARFLGIRLVRVDLENALRGFGKLVRGKMEKANLSARMRMAILYLLAARHDGLVVGTGDKSELLLGYFTKYGDGAADILPLGGLYKTQVRELAASIGIPRRILQKPSSPALWKGQTAEAELGFTYAQADAVLMAIEKGEKRSVLERRFGKRLVSAVVSRVEKNNHKRLPPPICSV